MSNIFSLGQNDYIAKLNILAGKGVSTTVNATVGGTTTLDCSLGNNFLVIMGAGNTTIAFSNIPNVTGYKVAVHVQKDNSSTQRTITWPVSVRWPGSSTPILSTSANIVDVFEFRSLDAGVKLFGRTYALNYAYSGGTVGLTGNSSKVIASVGGTTNADVIVKGTSNKIISSVGGSAGSISQNLYISWLEIESSTSSNVVLSWVEIEEVAASTEANFGVNLSDGSYFDLHPYWRDGIRQQAESGVDFAVVGNGSLRVSCDASGWPQTDFAIGMPWLEQSASPRVFNWKVTGSVGSITTPGGWSSSINAYDSGTNSQTGTITMPANLATGNYGSFSFINTKRTSVSAVNTGVQKIQVLRPGYTDFAAADANDFTNEIQTILGQFDGPLRMMDFQGTNGDISVHTEATRRTPANTPTRLFRTPDERCIAFANWIGRDPWMHIPIAAADDYITGLATRLQSTLNAGRNVYIELSNEVWNFGGGFSQTRYALRQGCIVGKAFLGNTSDTVTQRGFVSLTRASNVLTIVTEEAHGWSNGETLKYNDFGGAYGSATITVVNSTTATIPLTGADGTLSTGASVSAVNLDAFLGSTLSIPGETTIDGAYPLLSRWYTRRVKEVSDLFRAVWGDAAMNAALDSRRVRIVIGDQMSTIQFEDNLRYLAGRWNARNVNQYIWGIAGADYAGLNQPEIYGFGVNSSTDSNPATTQANFETWLQESMAAGWKAYRYEQRKARCIKYAIKNVQYEMGTDTFGDAGANNIKKAEATFNATTMQIHYRNYMERFYKLGGDVICWYHGGIQLDLTSQYGSWSIFRLTPSDTTSAKIAAAKQLVAAGKPTGGYRNTVPATIPGNYRYNSDSGANPNIDWTVGWLVYSESATTLALSIVYTEASIGDDARNFDVHINGNNITTLTMPTRGATGNYTLGPVSVTLVQGWNAVDFYPAAHLGKPIVSLTFA